MRTLVAMAVRDRDEWLNDLGSPDAERRINALHRACPCHGPATEYEEFMPLIAKMKKDSSPAVRKVALHVERDALDQLLVADLRSVGYERNRAGGHGRRSPKHPLKARRPG